MDLFFFDLRSSSADSSELEPDEEDELSSSDSSLLESSYSGSITIQVYRLPVRSTFDQNSPSATLRALGTTVNAELRGKFDGRKPAVNPALYESIVDQSEKILVEIVTNDSLKNCANLRQLSPSGSFTI